MGAKSNQRVALTKQLIYQAFFTLLKKKSIRQISIRELCEIAGINRTTFYNHYGSQYDVLAEMADNYLGEIAKAIENTDVKNKERVHSRVALVLHVIQDNPELSSMLMNNDPDETFAQRLFSLPEIQDEKEKAATIAFAIHGSYKVLQDWINDPERVSPEEETELILTLAGRVCGWKS